MFNAQPLVVDIVDDLRREYGLWQILRALLAARMRQRRLHSEWQSYSTHLLRDIGLSEADIRSIHPDDTVTTLSWMGFRL